MNNLGASLLDWAATGASCAGVLASMVSFELVQRVAIRFGDGPHQRVVCQMARGINLGARLAGARFHAEGLRHVAPGKSYLIVSNHQSMFDIAMASEYLAPLRPRYVSKVELAKGVPGVSYNLAHGGSALIDRKDPAQALAAIEALGRNVRDRGWSALIFPEGTRSRSGAMKPFREAGLRALVRAAPGVEVLPVTTSGGSRLFKNNLKPITRNVDLVFRIHPPMAPPAASDDGAFAAFVQALHGVIEAGLPDEDRAGTWASEQAPEPRRRPAPPATAARGATPPRAASPS